MITLSYNYCIVAVLVAAVAVAGYYLYHRFLQPSDKPALLERIDKVLSGGIRKQFLGFVSIIVIILVGSVILAFFTDDTIFGREDIKGKIWGVVYHFLDPGNLSMEQKSTPMQWFTLLVALSGMVLMSGLLISTISNIIERRIEKVERGQATYRKINNHYVIIGYGDITLSLIKEIFKQHGWKEEANDSGTGHKRRIARLCLPKIIILSNENTPDIHADILSYLPCELERKIIIYSGNMESVEHLSRLNIDKALEVYILGDMDGYGRDSKNLECVRMISQLRKSVKERGILKVNVQIDRTPSYSTIQKLSLPDTYIQYNGETNLYFRPFNFHENWARMLWSYYADKEQDYYPLDFETMEGDKHVHLVIIGFNRMGRALLLEALRLCHYPNFIEENEGVAAKNKTHITVIDKEMDSQLPLFESQYPYLAQISDVEITFQHARAEDKAVRRMIEDFAKDGCTLLTIAVCMKDPDMSLSVGLNLPEPVYYEASRITKDKHDKVVNENRPRVLIRQELQKGLGEILDKDEMRYKNVRIFGMLTKGIDARLLSDTIPMYVNAYYECKYMQYQQEGIKGKILGNLNKFINDKCAAEPAFKSRTFLDWLNDDACYDKMSDIAKQLWYVLSEDLRFANRYQVDIYDLYLKYFTSAALAQVEHLRWCAERSITGYRLTVGAERKSFDFKLHPLLVPFNQLSEKSKLEKEKEKDEDVIKNMLVLIEISKKHQKVY